MSKHTPGAGSIRDIEQKKREVLKPLLENPFTQGTEWPTIDRSVAETIMECLIQVLSGYGIYLEMRSLNKDKKIPVPEVAGKITIGFNSTVKKLEKQAGPNRAKLLGKPPKRSKQEQPNTPGYVKYVFVAKSDISTSLLTSCFPLLTYSASRSALDRVKLVELPRGAMQKLSKVLRTDNVSIISLEEKWADGKLLFDVVDSNIRDVEVPWLAALFDENSAPVYEKPNIKFVKTSVPVGRANKKKNGVLKKKKNRKNEGRVLKP
ncbi:hypothetical protein METBIDRAFT_41210 [Metschnikowia bicuspidata var. bicuspidata NRRL YB-4993]|uniref:Uncharacterized protein n=1 Tax=Metschnikowia bicuspidata var. bicuspidata NRRL YB-4993 TaxID=869754 RepID=A0A1A0HAT0_9ASCO|nr:hypothetical protein METBIDRAFT_41210 [Metschnikowia bicuspidata var. bicuspidata NRRL YB-4993]OBA20993.1 hypothetical protein METBIDRAFT_41210 [Metschnikowia bicuspidata var. bicuspidata NRRL YB-4993]